MSKFNFFLMIGLLSCLIISYKLAAIPINGPGFIPVHNGIFTGMQGGMLNTLADDGKNPDTGTLGAHIAYLAAFKKPAQKHYSYFKGGIDYEAGFGPSTPLQGFGLFADTGAVLFDIWRIGAGMAFNYLTKKDLAAGLLTGWTVSPYFETAIMWKPFEKSGFDFGFRLGAPVKITGDINEPYHKVNKLNQLDWKFTFSYFYFFGGKNDE